MIVSSILLALREIRRNLLRSFLTILGIVIGVAAVITMVTVGNGATQAVKDQISSLGSNLLMVRPGQRLGPGMPAAGAPTDCSMSLAMAAAFNDSCSACPWDSIFSCWAIAPKLGRESAKQTMQLRSMRRMATSGLEGASTLAGRWPVRA